jgi:hypothetical protein
VVIRDHGPLDKVYLLNAHHFNVQEMPDFLAGVCVLEVITSFSVGVHFERGSRRKKSTKV